MLSFEDCLGLSGVSEDDLHLIARRLRVPAIAACGPACLLADSTDPLRSGTRSSASRLGGGGARAAIGAKPTAMDAYAPPIHITTTDAIRLAHLLEGDPRGCPQARGFLAGELVRACRTAPWQISPTTVTMNSRLLYRHEETKRQRQTTLVYPDDAGSANRVSVLSALGSTLLGLSEGQTLRYLIKDGQWQTLTVVKVLYQPEAHGHFDC